MKLANNTTQHQSIDNNKKEEIKQQYQSPRLMEYGNLVKSTQGSSGPMGDGSGSKQA